MKSKEFFSTVFAKAKDLANEMTLHNTRVKRLVKQEKIEKEYADNDCAVRKMLHERGIVPEKLPAGEDVKKVERRLKKGVEVNGDR